MQAAENFKRQENPAGFGDVPSMVSQPTLVILEDPAVNSCVFVHVVDRRSESASPDAGRGELQETGEPCRVWGGAQHGVPAHTGGIRGGRRGMLAIY